MLGWLFSIGHETVVGSITDPEDGKAVAKTLFGAVFIYIAFLAFCGCQIWTIQRQNRIRL